MAVNKNFLISLYKFPKSHSISAKMLVIGAGKMGKLVFKHLASKGCRKIVVFQALVEVHILWCMKYYDIFWVMASSGDRAWNALLALENIAFNYTFTDVLIEIQVSVGQSKAKIEAIMNDFIKLEPQSNVFEAETMIEGTLDGYSFDSDEEGEKVPKPPANQSDQNEENGDQANPKTKRKAERLSGKVNKKAKAAVRPSKTVKKTKKSKK